MVSRPRQGTAVAASLVAALLVVGFLAFAALVAIPPSLANLASEPSDGQTRVALDGVDGSAGVVAPLGWIVVRESAGSVLVRTPDSAMTVRLDVVDEVPSGVVTADAAATGETRTEVLTTGLAIVHADLDGGGVVAGVGLSGPDAAPSVRVVATMTDGVDMRDYRPALAELLDGITS